MGSDTMPDRLGDYRVVKPLGRGNFGRTYLAEHDGIDHDRVVIKVLTSKGDARVEGENLAKLAQYPHPNVVPFRTMFKAKKTGHCIVMGYVEGESLEKVMEDHGEFELDEWWPIFKKILLGVDHIHRQGLIHQDIKPANVIFDRRGEPKIVDLGGARNADGSGTVVYTPGYAAWEVHSPIHTLGTFSDIYALALVFAEAIFGDGIPNEREGIERARARLANEFGSFGESIAKGLMFEPQARPQTVTEWLAELVDYSTRAADDDTKPSASFHIRRSQTGIDGLTIKDIVDDIETRLGLPSGSVAICGDEGEADGDRNVADVLMDAWNSSDWEHDIDEWSCGGLRHHLSQYFSLGVELVEGDGRSANGNLLIRTLKQRHATES